MLCAVLGAWGRGGRGGQHADAAEDGWRKQDVIDRQSGALAFNVADEWSQLNLPRLVGRIVCVCVLSLANCNAITCGGSGPAGVATPIRLCVLIGCDVIDALMQTPQNYAHCSQSAH